MFSVHRTLFLVSVIGFCGVGTSYADFDESSSFGRMDDDSSGIRVERKRWEFGLQFGQAIATGNKSSSIVAENSAFLVSDPAFPGEDEFTENGLTPPDFTGQTVIQGDLSKSFVLGAHWYYKLTPWIATGIEADYAFEYKIDIAEGGPFTAPIYATKYRAHGFQQVFALRLGDWMGNVRPYVMGESGLTYGHNPLRVSW